jgi:serine/threonine protein kinase
MSRSFIGKVLDNYRILERLGIGGMGVVFKAIHIKLDKIFAVKIIAPGLALNENFIRRFETEAKALAKFEDPNIVRIYDLRTANDQWFIVMEYVEGTTLSDLIEKYGRIPWRKAIPLFKQMLSAISHAHEAGIIHRDIKPNNIMLTDSGIVKITDFGLAKDQANVGQTMTVSSGGTLFYMSPEHVKGFSFIDARSDIYTLGMTFYEMITGTVPLKDIESDFDIREAIVRKEFEKPSSFEKRIPANLDNIIMKAIRKNPDERYQTADEMLNAIENLEHPGQKIAVGERPSKAEVHKSSQKVKVPDDAVDRTDRPLKRHRQFLVRSLSFATIVIILSIIGYRYYPQINTLISPQPAIQSISDLSINTDPQNASIMINGELVGESPLQHYSIEAGTYNLRIDKENYLPVDTSMTVASGTDLALAFKLIQPESEPHPLPLAAKSEIKQRPTRKPEVPRLASLSVSSEPNNSEIWLEGRFRGNTPLYLEDIKPGTYIVEVRKSGYQTSAQRLTLVAGNNQSVTAQLNLQAGEILIRKDPLSADVFIDGNLVSTENKAVNQLKNISPGEHQIEISQDGYSTHSETILVTKNETANVTAELARLEGELSIQVRPWGSIYIDDQLQKKSVDIRHKVTLPVKEYMVRVMHPTLGVWQRPVTVLENKTTEVTVNFTKNITVEISAVDEDGNAVFGDIHVDGENIGKKTPGKITLRTGIHQISVIKEGYTISNGNRTICVDEQLDSPLKFTLKKGT